eukprot:10338638-Lingulodinium_polyedra.AAC.1
MATGTSIGSSVGVWVGSGLVLSAPQSCSLLLERGFAQEGRQYGLEPGVGVFVSVAPARRSSSSLPRACAAQL